MLICRQDKYMTASLSLLRSSLPLWEEESYQEDIFHKYILFSYYRSLKQYLNNMEEIWLFNVLFIKKRTWDNESFKLPEKCIWVWSTLRKQNLKENRGHLKKTANNTEKEFQLFEESKCNEKYEVQSAVMVPVLLHFIYSSYEKNVSIYSLQVPGTPHQVLM